jgi:hypothetical protein
MITHEQATVANPDVAAVGVLVVQDGSPVVGGVFLESTSCAGRGFGIVGARIHGNIETESSISDECRLDKVLLNVRILFRYSENEFCC